MIIHRHTVIHPRTMMILLRDTASTFPTMFTSQGTARHTRNAEVAFIEHAFLQELVYDGFLGGAAGGFGHEAGIHGHGAGVEVGNEGEEDVEEEVEEGVRPE